MQLKIIERRLKMITDIKTVVNTLIVVLFLTMVVLEPTILNFSYFSVLFYFLFKIR